ncbi:tetratricopeptide repeat protein [Pedobacter cryoconitis]|uniref:tetratricopeptide repeat-containing sensor histidine kinase n=1 Tax=Pedobacter cryoconitis TaxID=188932 RepID=UPI00161ED698|nr:tetratricopeptide repeat protein [Pedobacter cryoconitis]MBB5644007.1 tetratricopeptide (TPR) repeat protein [Pedobacter cryoconitis]
MSSRTLQFCFTLLLLFSEPILSKANVPQEYPEINAVNKLVAEKNFKAATILLDQLISKNRKTKNKEFIAKLYSTSGNLNLSQRNIDKALQAYFLSLNYLDSTQNPLAVSKVYTNIGTLYAILKNLPKGKEYYLKSLSINKEGNSDHLKTLSNIAGVYVELAEDNNALQSFSAAIKLAEKLTDLPMEAVLQTNLGNYFLKKKQWTKAINASKRSILIRTQLKQPVSVITLNNLGYALAQTGKNSAAISYYKTALPIANPLEKKQLYFNLYNASKTMHELPAALQYMEQYNSISDSLTRLNYDNKVAELTASYESAQKEGKINALQKENLLQKLQLREQTYLILAAVLIVLLISILLYMRIKNHNVKEALEKSQLKRQMLLLQLNPHFIFNALQSVQHFIRSKDQQHSMEYLESFSRLIRLILENSDRDLIPLAQEIEILEHYLHLQQLANGSSFSYRIETGPGVEPEMMEIPVMLLQPFVENAVVHGVKNHPQGKILIRFELKLRSLHIWIRDNGNDFQKTPDYSNNSLHRSMGMTILEQRIAELNKERRQYIQLSIEHPDSTAIDYPGTSVHFKFNN